MLDLRAKLQAAVGDRYTIERELNRGGMSILFLAQDPRYPRSVAVKVLRPELAAALGPERFLQEIRVAAGLAHAHIVPLFDSGEGHGCLYYVMPYIAGESLRERLLRETRLPVEDAVAIARQVASALDYAHRAGVVHRDIKPENIMLVAQQAQVTDFGIARAISAAGGSHMTATGIAVGTPDYMSPEQAAGDEDIDGRSDIYSLGCVLFEMLVGRAPFSGTTPQKVLAQKFGNVAPTLTNIGRVPDAVANVVGRALQKQREDRFATAGEFEAALAEAGKTAAVPRVRTRWAAAIALVAVGGALALGWARFRNRPVDGNSALDPTHIAVLYFDDLSDGARLGPVASGLTEDLIDRLSQVEALHVITPGGVRQFRGAAVSPDSIARSLQVGTLVAGSVSRSQDQLRVTIRLVDGANGQQLYSQTLTRAWGDLFVLEDSLTADLESFLRQRLGETIAARESRLRTNSVEAWRAMRQGDAARDDARVLDHGGDLAGAIRADLRADSAYVRASALDPHWSDPIVARGWVAYSLAYLSDSRSLAEARAHPNPREVSSGPLFFDEWMHIGLRRAEEALRVKPGAPSVLALRGALRYALWNQSYVTAPESVAAAEGDLRRAIQGDPSLAVAWYRLSELFRFTGRFSEADWAARGALRADAYLADALRVHTTLFYTALNRERYDEAEQWCRVGRARYPDDVDFRSCEVRVLGWSGRGRGQVAKTWRLIRDIEAGRAEEQSGALWAERRLLVAAVLARSALPDSARALIRLARTDAADTAAAWMLGEEAWVRLLLGERVRALALLRRGVASSGQMRSYVAVSPWYTALHSDPGFRALVGEPAATP